MRRVHGPILQVFSSAQQRLGTNVDVFVGDFFDFDHVCQTTAACYDPLTAAIYVHESLERVLSDDELKALAAHELHHSMRLRSRLAFVGRRFRPLLWWLWRRRRKALWKAFAKQEKEPQEAGIREVGYETYVSSVTKSVTHLTIEQIKRLAEA